MGVPLLALVASSFFIGQYKIREKILVFLWFTVPFLTLTYVGKMLYPRYLLFLSIVLLPLTAYSFYILCGRFLNRKQYIQTALIAVFFLGYWLYADFFIITDITRAPLPEKDRTQYSDGWPSGWGLTHIVSYLEKESEHNKLTVLSEGIYGSLPTTTLEIYLGKNKNVRIHPLWPVNTEPPAEYQTPQEMPVYLLINQTQEIPPWNMQLVQQYQKGRGNSYIRLFRLIYD